MLVGGGSVGRLRLDYLCVLAVASCYQRRPLRLPAILQWMPGGVVPTLSADAGGAPKDGFRPAAPASARGHGLRCQRTPRGASTLSTLPPPVNSQYREFCKYFLWRVLHPPSRILESSDDKTAAAVGAGVGTAAGVGLAAGVGFALVAVS